jgi:ABC-type glycerol-3-phosphate transport system permease component
MRVVAATVGAYALAAAFAYALARALPMTRSEAAAAATMLGTLAMPGAVIWVFAARSAGRAWVGVVMVTLMFGVAAWLLGQPG